MTVKACKECGCLLNKHLRSKNPEFCKICNNPKIHALNFLVPINNLDENSWINNDNNSYQKTQDADLEDIFESGEII